MLSATTRIYCPDQCIKDPDPLNSFYSIGLHKQIPVIMIQEYWVKKSGQITSGIHLFYIWFMTD